jgi:drug/metabolite transporter (DMT)-like permease
MELTAAFYGLLCAGALGVSDFVARFTSRAVGPMVVAAGMLAFGGLVCLGLALALGLGIPTSAPHLGLTLASGVISGLGMVLIYTALTLGPLSYVIPLAATYPIWAVLYAVAFQGLAVTPLLAFACLVTLAGGWLVAAYGELTEEGPSLERASALQRLLVVVCALGAGLALVVSVYLVGPAAAASSEIGTLAVARGIAAATVGLLLLARPRRLPPGSHRWLPLIALQGVLDGLGIYALYAATAVPEGAFGVVISSAFGVVTVLLGWSLLRERINPRQWLGILMAMGGAASITALS